jgi:ribosome modulation factor
MKKVSQQQIDEAYQKGVSDALSGQRGAPSGYEHPELIRAWMNGYDSTAPDDCKAKPEEPFP